MAFEFDTYVIVYLLSSILGTYAKYEFLKRFYIFDKNKIKDFSLFVSYYFIVGLIYLEFNIPILTLLSNIVFIFCIALTYDKDIKKAAFASIQMIGLMLAIEIIVVLSTGYVLVPMQIISENDYNSIFGPILTTIMFYLVVVLIQKLGVKKRFNQIPLNYWIFIFIIPISSMYFLVTLLEFENLSKLRISIMAAIVLLINFSIFKVYDLLSEYFEKKVEKEVEENLIDAYSMQLEMMKTIDENIYSFQHDLNKHMYSLKTLVKSGDLDRIEGYLDEMGENVKTQSAYSKSGNMIIDSIINYELSKIKLKEVELLIDTGFVPEDTQIEDYDLTIVLSNLLNNAIDALEKQQTAKRLDIKIKFDKGILFLNIENTFEGELKLDKNNLISTKSDTKRHGYGLKNVDRIVKKYNGEKVFDYGVDIFSVKVILYT